MLLIARYYQPEQGVFLSLDSDPGDDDDILTQNGYSYGNNNPVKLYDPDGNRGRGIGSYAAKYGKKTWERAFYDVGRLLYCRKDGIIGHFFCQIIFKKRAVSFFDHATMVREVDGSYT